MYIFLLLLYFFVLNSKVDRWFMQTDSREKLYSKNRQKSREWEWLRERERIEKVKKSNQINSQEHLWMSTSRRWTNFKFIFRKDTIHYSKNGNDNEFIFMCFSSSPETMVSLNRVFFLFHVYLCRTAIFILLYENTMLICIFTCYPNKFIVSRARTYPPPPPPPHTHTHANITTERSHAHTRTYTYMDARWQ